MPDALIHHRPKTGLQAKFSMEFCMVVLLLERKASLAQFSMRMSIGQRFRKWFRVELLH